MDPGNDEWRASQEQFIALSVAAAMAFHQAQGGTAAIESRQDHDDALNIAASALSRLVTIYVMDLQAHTRVPRSFDLVSGRFVNGATAFRAHDGTRTAELYVRRGDLASALSLIQRTRVPLALWSAAPSPAKGAAAEGEAEKPEKSGSPAKR